MKRSSIMLFLAGMSMALFAQGDLVSRLSKNVIDCSDVSQNSAELFVAFLQEQQYDSAAFVLDFWESYCGMREPLQRARILLSILDSELSEAVYDTSIMKFIELYKFRLDLEAGVSKPECIEYYAPFLCYIPPASHFDNAIRDLASGIEDFDNELERLFSLLYAEKIDSFYYTIQEPVYEPYLVRSLYDREVEKLLKLPEGHVAIGPALFVPTGNMKTLGLHPEIDMSFGFTFSRFTVDAIFNIRFEKTAFPYQILKLGSIMTTDYFLGGLYGLELQYELVGTPKHKVYLSAGAGLDGFDTGYWSTDYNIISVTNANINFGLQYRWYYNQKNYLGLCYHYNLVNYSIPELITDLSGNYHTFSLNFGITDNIPKRNGLKELNYRSKD